MIEPTRKEMTAIPGVGALIREQNHCRGALKPRVLTIAKVEEL